jgi:hypothetical protein
MDAEGGAMTDDDRIDKLVQAVDRNTDAINELGRALREAGIKPQPRKLRCPGIASPEVASGVIEAFMQQVGFPEERRIAFRREFLEGLRATYASYREMLLPEALPEYERAMAAWGDPATAQRSERR